MGLKKYFFFSLLLIVIIAGYIFSINSNDYRIEILDNGFVLPIAVWVILPVFVLFVLSFLHMIYYGTKGYFEKNALKKDLSKLFELVNARLIGQDVFHAFKTQEAKEISSVIAQLKMEPNNPDFTSTHKETSDLASKIIRINAGEYVSSKELKLPNSNSLMEKNLLNKLKVDNDFCLDVIKKSDNYTPLVVNDAISSMIKNKSITTVKKNLDNIKLTKDLAFAIFEKDSLKHESFSLSRDDIKHIVNPLEFSKSDFIKLAKIYKKAFGPDEIIKLFEDLSTKYEDATHAYLYVLFEYEMLDNIREILANSSNDEYIPFKAMLDLKDAGKHYRLDALCLN